MTTLEAAFLIPLVICFLCMILLGFLQMFQDAGAELQTMQQENAAELRQPAAVIRNTDLVFVYLERIQQAWEAEK